MKGFLLFLGILIVAALVRDSYLDDRKDQQQVAENRQFLREGDSLRRIIQEHADSASAILPRIEWRERIITRLVTKTDTLRLTASAQADSGQWEAAYRTRTQEADTLRVALNVQTLRAEDAITMSSYWQLAFIADSTRREEAEHRLAITTSVIERTTKWYRRLGVTVGVDISGKPNAVVGYRLWP